MSRVLGPQEWFTAAELASRRLIGLPATKRGVQMLADRQGWADQTDDAGRALCRSRKGRGGGVEYHLTLLPEAVQGQLALTDRAATAERADRETTWARFDRLPDSMKSVAHDRLEVIQAIEDLIRAGLGKEKALQTVTAQARRVATAAGQPAPYSESAVRAWFARINGVEPADRLAYLAPDYQGRAAGELDRNAFEHFTANYLRPAKPTLAACYHQLVRAAEANGWKTPSLKTLQRRLDAEIPRDVQTFLREGDNALAHAFPHMERSRAGIGALQIVNLDGHTWDVRVEWPDGTIGRPLSVAVQDIASGKALALRFDQTLNQHLVRLALADTFRDHGIPSTCIMDNGRENAAASIAGGQSTRWRWKIREDEPAGLLKTLGITAVFATPYWGQAKPIERMFRDWAGEIAKHPAFEGAYTGKDTASKPANYGERAIPVAEFEAIVREELVHYNARLGRSGPHMAGRSFDQVFAELAAVKPPRQATAEQLRLALLASHPVRMNPRDGAVQVADHRYWSPELAALKPQKVVVRFDPENLAAPVHLYSLDGRYLAEATRIRAGNFDDSATAQAHGRDRRAYQSAVKAAARAKVKLDAAAVAAALPAPAPVDQRPTRKPPAVAGNVVTPAFGVPRTAEAAAPTNFVADWEKGAALLAGSGG